MNLTTLTQAINQFLNQYFNTSERHFAVTEEMVPFIFGGGALIILVSIFLMISFSRRKTSVEGDPFPVSGKAADKKLEKLEKEHLKRQQKEDKKRKEGEIQKEKERLIKFQKEEQQIQQELVLQEEKRKQSQVLKRALKPKLDEQSIPESKNFIDRLKQGMEKTRVNLVDGVSNLVIGKKEINEELLDELEELLITADIGPETTVRIIESMNEELERNELKDPSILKEMLKEEIINIMGKEYTVPTTNEKKPLILLFVGVNGVGKTTTIGKIAAQYCKEGKRVLMGAGDTFRAAAIEQLIEWSDRASCDIVAKEAGSDPSSVMYETVQKAVNENYDVVICDTAGRLHTKKNLMEELKKMVRVIKKIVPDAPHETLLVLDATTGQNAIFQVREFNEVADLTGLVVTKLDGTAKGGVVIGIVNEFDVPVRYIGVGEGIEDLRPFDSKDFTQSLFMESD